MPKTVLEVNLAALDAVEDINTVIDTMELDTYNELVVALREAVEDFQERKGLRAFLKEAGHSRIYLTFSWGGED